MHASPRTSFWQYKTNARPGYSYSDKDNKSQVEGSGGANVRGLWAGPIAGEITLLDAVGADAIRSGLVHPVGRIRGSHTASLYPCRRVALPAHTDRVAGSDGSLSLLPQSNLYNLHRLCSRAGDHAGAAIILPGGGALLALLGCGNEALRRTSIASALRRAV